MSGIRDRLAIPLALAKDESGRIREGSVVVAIVVILEQRKAVSFVTSSEANRDDDCDEV